MKPNVFMLHEHSNHRSGATKYRLAGVRLLKNSREGRAVVLNVQSLSVYTMVHTATKKNSALQTMMNREW